MRMAVGADCAHGRQPLVYRKQSKRKAEGTPKPMRFTSLHHHSTFSYGDGFQLPEAHVRRATELNMGALALTEHGNVSSHVQLEIAAEKQGIKPIFGVELYTGELGENATQRKNHLTILAENEQGYRSMLQLVTRSFSEGFYYEPTVTGRMLREHKDGLIVLSGCLGSLLATTLVGGKHVPEGEGSYEKGKKIAQKFQRTFGDSYYLEVQAFPELEKTRALNPMMEQLSYELGIPMVADKDCHYVIPEENEMQKILHNTRPGENRTVEEMAREWSYDVYLCPPATDMSIYRELRATGLSKRKAQEAVFNSEIIAERCNVTLPKLPQLRYPVEAGETGVGTWRKWLKDGWRYRGCHKLPPKLRREYSARLRYEMEIIEGKDYVDYFLVVADAVVYAKDHGIPVGPARGSAAASLACWLLRITEVNPLLFPNLVFERFIDVSREDLPDIDLDFDSDRRDEVREYLSGKYGEGRVSNIGTFTYYKSKLALDDVARVHRIPKFEVDQVKEVLVERSSGDLRASATIEDTVEQFAKAKDVFDRYPDLRRAMQLEGNVKGFGVHAAGLVVSNGPITDVCAVHVREVPKGSGRWLDVISLDKYDAERQGLIKMDFLGLATMAMISEALRQLRMDLTELYELRLDDDKVLAGFQANDVVGIFQFDGTSTRQVNGSLQPDSFKEVCDICALSRPGPLHNGAANEYIDIKRGAKKPERIHPALDAITEDTNFQIVYQEQILRIVREVGGFDWTHAAYIRKIISKKLGDAEFNRQWVRYWEGAQRLHPDMSEATARKIWGMCITAGSYAFNAAHSVSYGMIAYWTMWLKVYHPAVFFASSLAKMPARLHEGLMRDASRGNEQVERRPIAIMPPSPKHSSLTWTARRVKRKQVLQAGFKQITGVADKVGKNIVSYRDDHGGIEAWDDLVNINGIGPKTVERIKDFVEQDDPFDVYKLDNAIDAARRWIEEEGKLPVPTHKSTDVPYERGEDCPVIYIGVVRKKNQRDIFESNRARTGEELDPATVKRPDLNEFMMLHCYDGEDLLIARINRFKYPQFKQACWDIKFNHDLVLIQGTKPGWRTAREVYVNNMWVLDPEV